MHGSGLDAETDRNAALGEVEQQYSAVLTGIQEAVLFVDSEGRIANVNRAACEMYGYQREEMLGLSANTLVHPDSLLDAGKVLGSLGPGEVRERTYLATRKDGSVFHVQERISSILVDGKPHVLSMEQDVSAQVRAEDELREREDQYRRIFDSTSDGLIINDPLRGVVVEANPAVCRMHGYSYDEFIGLHATEFIHPDFHHTFVEFVETISAGGTYACQAIDTRKDGSVFHVDVHGSSVMYQGRPHILAAVRDITDRVRSRELLQQRLDEQARVLATLIDVSRNVSASTEVQPLLGTILDHLKEAVDYADAAILIPEEGTVRPIGYRGPLPEEIAVQVRFPIDERFPAWDVMELQQTVLIEDVKADTPMARKYRASLGGRDDLDLGGTHMAVPMIYQGRVVGAIALSHPQPGAFTPDQSRLVQAIAQQAAIAIENSRLYREAQALAAVAERQRLSRELHDSVTQALFSMTLHAQTARLQMVREGVDPDGALAQTVGQLADLTQGALAEMRALIFELRPDALRDEGLVAAIRKHAAGLNARTGVDIRIEANAGRIEMPSETEEQLYRLTQEALNNVVKHARASGVIIAVENHEVDRSLELRISDDGVGFDVNQQQTGHFGLKTMAERAQIAGGILSVKSQIGSGTTVCVRVPLDP